MMLGRITAAAIIVAAATLFFATVCLAHGVSYEMVETSPAVSFKSAFSSGEPIAYGEVLIYSPSDSEVEYQNGRTDKHGVFTFLPDQPGTWKVEVDGGLGHKLMFDVPVSAPEGKMKSEIKAGTTHSSKPVKAALGISLLLNVALAALYWKKRK